jgi:hypothetical protein
MTLMFAIALMAGIIGTIGGITGSLLMYWLIKIRPAPKITSPVIESVRRRRRHNRPAPTISHDTEVRSIKRPAMAQPLNDDTRVPPPNPHGIQPSPTLKWRA